MKQLLSTLLFAAPLCSLAQSPNNGRLLSEGTIVKVALLNDLNGKDLSVGQTIALELNDPIVLNGDTAVARGARVTGTVTEAERSKALGKKGKLAFSIDYLYLPDGKTVKLRNQVEKNLKGSGAAVAAGAVLLSPVALLIPGKNARYYKGDVFTAYVDKETTL